MAVAVEEGGAAPGSGRISAASDAPAASDAGEQKTPENLKEQGNLAFTRAQVLKRTTAGKQYLSEAKVFYAEALTKLGQRPANDHSLQLACTLHSNLAAVFLLEVPPKWREAKAAAEIALSVDMRHVKSLFRRAQAHLEDGRAGLPEASLRAALTDLEAALAAEPGNAQVAQEAERIRRRVVALEEARRIPAPGEIAGRVSEPLRDRGGDCLALHGYVWGQTEAAVHIFVPALGAKLAKASDVEVKFGSRSLLILLNGAGSPSSLELSGRLHKPIRPDDSDWQIEEGGLLLHVELAKRVVGEDAESKPGTGDSIIGAGDEEEHWRCVWDGHPETNAPSAEQRRNVKRLAHAACRAEAEEPKEEDTNPKVAETLKNLREMCPGVDISWGDTSLDAYR